MVYDVTVNQLIVLFISSGEKRMLFFGGGVNRLYFLL